MKIGKFMLTNGVIWFVWSTYCLFIEVDEALSHTEIPVGPCADSTCAFVYNIVLQHIFPVTLVLKLLLD